MAGRFQPNEALEEIAAEYHHLQNEHKREGVAGSTRRRMESRLAALEERFHTILERWYPDEALRHAWREYLYARQPAPSSPPLASPPLFKGRSQTGSRAEVQEGEDGAYEIFVDGALMKRIPTPMTLEQRTEEHLMMAQQDFVEIFDAPESAREALFRYVRRGSGAPPWEWARELYEDGLIDENFSLTPRGNRMISLYEEGGEVFMPAP